MSNRGLDESIRKLNEAEENLNNALVPFQEELNILKRENSVTVSLQLSRTSQKMELINSTSNLIKSFNTSYEDKINKFKEWINMDGKSKNNYDMYLSWLNESKIGGNNQILDKLQAEPSDKNNLNGIIYIDPELFLNIDDFSNFYQDGEQMNIYLENLVQLLLNENIFFIEKDTRTEQLDWINYPLMKNYIDHNHNDDPNKENILKENILTDILNRIPFDFPYPISKLGSLSDGSIKNFIQEKMGIFETKLKEESEKMAKLVI